MGMVPLETKCLFCGYFHPLYKQAGIYHKEWLRGGKNIVISSTGFPSSQKFLKWERCTFVSLQHINTIYSLHFSGLFYTVLWLPLCPIGVVLGQLTYVSLKQTGHLKMNAVVW